MKNHFYLLALMPTTGSTSQSLLSPNLLRTSRTEKWEWLHTVSGSVHSTLTSICVVVSIRSDDSIGFKLTGNFA